jgi:hypothetical protein
MGPLNETMREERIDRQNDIKYDVPWTTLGEFLQHMEDPGISINIASCVGASEVRIHEMGYEDREPSEQELENMKQLDIIPPYSTLIKLSCKRPAPVTGEMPRTEANYPPIMTG